jgi:hypothetical protein
VTCFRKLERSDANVKTLKREKKRLWGLWEGVNQRMYFLLDLERTIATSVPVYWKQNKHGYTKSLQHAGLYSEEEAARIVQNDFDNATVKIHQDFFFKIFGKEFKQHEGIY